jgi:hypothetical protein
MRIDRGDPGASLGLYGAVPFVVGLTDHLADLVARWHESIRLHLEAERLPQRIGTSRQNSPEGERGMRAGLVCCVMKP